MKLTPKQKDFLTYISRYIKEWGKPPSFDEICTHFRFRSYNTVTTYLKILERKGYIRLPQEKNRKRAVEVISPIETRRFEYPLLGTVAAGKPIEAVEDPSAIEVPPSMIGSGDHFVLRVRGDSMKEDGILDGDYVVIRKQPTVENGETVVALINNEATIKRYYKRKDHIELRPAHTEMEPILVKEGDLQIEGKVVGVMRYVGRREALGVRREAQGRDTNFPLQRDYGGQDGKFPRTQGMATSEGTCRVNVRPYPRC